MGEVDRIDRVELFIRQFNKANDIFSKAVIEKAVERKKVLLEQALIAYAEILPLLPRTDSWDIKLIRRTVLDKIHIIEAMLEQEIERSILISSKNSSGNSSSSISKLEEELAIARARLLAID